MTDSATLASPGFTETAEALLAAGGHRVALHLRGPATGGAALWRIAERLVLAAAQSGSRIVVNDRLDVALAAGAWGVQLGARSFPVATARTVLPAGTMIGASVHDPEEARSATARGADFLLAGTLFSSRSHPGVAGTGVGWIARVAGRLPIIGIGGITPERVAEVIAAGASGVAVISGVFASRSPVDAQADYLSALGI